MPIHHPLGFKQHPLEDAGTKTTRFNKINSWVPYNHDNCQFLWHFCWKKTLGKLHFSTILFFFSAFKVRSLGSSKSSMEPDPKDDHKWDRFPWYLRRILNRVVLILAPQNIDPTGFFGSFRFVQFVMFLTSWWFFTNPSEKYAKVKLNHFPNFRGENKKDLKPPPSLCLLCEYLMWFVSIGWFLLKICTLIYLPWFPIKSKVQEEPVTLVKPKKTRLFKHDVSEWKNPGDDSLKSTCICNISTVKIL